VGLALREDRSLFPRASFSGRKVNRSGKNSHVTCPLPTLRTLVQQLAKKEFFNTICQEPAFAFLGWVMEGSSICDKLVDRGRGRLFG
jgi:hypothetical protein